MPFEPLLQEPIIQKLDFQAMPIVSLAVRPTRHRFLSTTMSTSSSRLGARP